MAKDEPKRTEAPRPPRTFDIDEIDPPDAIRIYGEAYRLARATDLSLMDRAAFNRARKRMAYLEEMPTPREKDQAEHRKLSEEIARLAVPDAPHEVVAKLSNDQLGAIVVVFFGRTQQTSGIVRTASELGLSMTSGTRSPDSSGSTGGTP
jgi:hypothetical protein